MKLGVTRAASAIRAWSEGALELRRRLMIRLCVLASGSKGNAIYLESPNARLLIDAGISASEIARRMAIIGRSPQNLDALLITHEHADHIRGAGALARKYNLPVHISEATLLSMEKGIGPLPRLALFEPGYSFTINDLTIRPFEVTHDAANPVNFIIGGSSGLIGIATDLGYASRVVKENLKECQAIIVEANHDPEMLEYGPYPWPLKQRIKSKYGHLSNEQGARLLAEVFHEGLKHVCLAHLSETNNNPRTALETVRGILGDRTEDVELSVAAQHRVSAVITL
jgi:phosphoribosyl 1,2-cyclic phosphodiesterase